MRANGRYATPVMVADNQNVNTIATGWFEKSRIYPIDPAVWWRLCPLCCVISGEWRHGNSRALRALPRAWSGETRVFWHLIMRRQSSPKNQTFLSLD